MYALKQCCALLLWVHLMTFVQCRDCTLQSFIGGNYFDENFEITNLRQSYASGDSVRVPCKIGFRGFFRLICTNGQWITKGERCAAISCGHPGDAPFADFKLVKGTDYNFGSQVLYTCQKGYQMTSFTNTRNCLQGGWDGHLPECEAIKCPPIQVNDNVQVSGDIYEPTFGNVLQFSCISRNDVLNGEMEIFCDEKGKWNKDPPTCKAISCENTLIKNGDAKGDKKEFKENEVLTYTCNQGYKKVDGRPSVCRKTGLTAQWTPMPECELITCKLSHDPPGTTTYDPQDQLTFRPGQSVRVYCGEKEWVKRTELQSADCICQDTGRWDFPPECQVVTCMKHGEHVHSWERSRYNTVKMDDTLWYWCKDRYDKTTDRAKCTRRGWEPDPLCKAKGCTQPSYRNALIDRVKDTYDHEETVRFQCTFYPDTVFTVTCDFGRWTGGLQCKEKPCTSQPVIDNAEMLDNKKQTYPNGDRVQFRCKGTTDTFMVTCQTGQWKTAYNCENLDCTTQPVVKNAVMAESERQEYINGERVNFKCLGETQTFKVTCQSGKWIADKECEERSICGSTAIPNGYSYLINTKLYYACSDGFKLLKGGWWNEATCVNGQWNKLECIASTDCGKVPAIPHMTATSERTRFSEYETLPITCEAGHQNLHPGLQKLTCKSGKWDSKGIDFKQICTSIETKCSPPTKVKNAVILAPFQKEYLSDTTLTFKCRDNYKMEGEDTIRCIGGTWEKKTMSCTAVQ